MEILLVQLKLLLVTMSNKCFNMKKLSFGLHPSQMNFTQKKMIMVMFHSKRDMKRDFQIMPHSSSMKTHNIWSRKKQF